MINKMLSSIVLVGLILFSLASQAYSSPQEITAEALKNCTYTLHPSKDRAIQVKLGDGSYSRTDSLDDFVMTRLERTSLGDLNNDGQADAAVILSSNYGGSGDFVELAAVINQNGLPKHVASALLGDRVEIKSLAIHQGIISVDMLTHGPQDAMANPTQPRRKRFKLAEGKLVSPSPGASGQIQKPSQEARVKKDLSLIITLKVAGQIQKADVWTDPGSDPHNWHKPMYYIALDANGDPNDGYYDNGQGPYSTLIQYDSGRYRLTWGGPDQNIRTKADNVICPPTGWLTGGVSPEQIECAEDFTAYISEDGTSLIVWLRQSLIGNPASLEVSFMASPDTSRHFDLLGNKPGDDGQGGWLVIPDATIQKTYRQKDAPENLAWPIEGPDLKANFDIIEGKVQILHVQ